MLFGLWERKEKKGLWFLTKCHLWTLVTKSDEIREKQNGPKKVFIISYHLSSVLAIQISERVFLSSLFSPSKGQGWECCFVIYGDRPISRLDITFCFSSPSIHIEEDVILLFDDFFRKVSGQLRSNQQSFFPKVCPSQFSHQELSYFCLFIITHANGIKMVHLNQNLNSM